MSTQTKKTLSPAVTVSVLGVCLGSGLITLWALSEPADPSKHLLMPQKTRASGALQLPPRPRQPLDDSGFGLVRSLLPRWDPESLESVRDAFRDAGRRHLNRFAAQLAHPGLDAGNRVVAHTSRALLFLYEGEPNPAYAELVQARAAAEADPEVSAQLLSMTIFLQGVAGLRRGETENCVECRGEGSCIFPIAAGAVHTLPDGSRLAVRHFTEYLRRHPDDLAVRWLLNVASMTLGEHPAGVPAEFLLPLERFRDDGAHGIGKFRDIAHLAGVNRFNMGGGAIMEDFDNDGLLDIVVSSYDPAMPLALYRNKGDGTFEERIAAAGFADQLGGMNCVQTDFNNDGFVDIFVIRGGWLERPVRPSLLRNNGDGTFTDVTRQAGLMRPVNSSVACWGDFDNDGWLDLFIACDRGPNLLYRNKGDGAFEEVGVRAGVAGPGRGYKGACWGDFNRDGYPDLFVNPLDGPPLLFLNKGDSTFREAAAEWGIIAPTKGFSAWCWDYDNDGWLDIYATAYDALGTRDIDRDLAEIVRGQFGEAPKNQTGRLYRNLGGKGFEDVTRAAGLDMVLSPMGSNFADFDNDGYLDFYLGTGWPSLSALTPNRMFRSIAGGSGERRFADITISSGTGHLQKGHGVACGDWDRDGNVDIFQQMGGPTPGDRFHNVLYENPGHGNSWLTVKLTGKRTNRAAIGATIKAVTDAVPPLTVYRDVTSGSSYGANPLQRTIGLGKASKVAVLEVHWPASNTTQVFRDVAANQAIEITELEASYRKLVWKRLAVLGNKG